MNKIVKLLPSVRRILIFLIGEFSFPKFYSFQRRMKCSCTKISISILRNSHAHEYGELWVSTFSKKNYFQYLYYISFLKIRNFQYWTTITKGLLGLWWLWNIKKILANFIPKNSHFVYKSICENTWKTGSLMALKYQKILFNLYS